LLYLQQGCQIVEYSRVLDGKFSRKGVDLCRPAILSEGVLSSSNQLKQLPKGMRGMGYIGVLVAENPLLLV
jgi:hypothetical protein